MATTKDIEDILGISKNKIDSWSRARDSNHLLVKFLKSFSKVDLQLRIDEILKDSGELLISPEEFLETLVKNLRNSGIVEFNDSETEEITKISQTERSLDNAFIPDMLIEVDGEHYIFEFKHLLPSVKNLSAQIDNIFNYAENNSLNLIRIIYIINNKDVPEKIDENEEIKSIASFYRFDDIAMNLFGKKVILTKPM